MISLLVANNQTSKQRIGRGLNSLTMASNYDEIFMQHSLQFADSLKDLKILRKQLYSAAEHFESSYNRDDRRQFVMESSKDYVAKALVSTVDHLGSVADKLNKFLDGKANEFSAANIQFSCIEQRLSTFQGFINLKALSQHLLTTEATGRHKKYIFPAAETFALDKSEVLYKNCISCPPYDVQQPKQDNKISKAFLAGRTKPDPPLLRKQQSRMPSREPSLNPPSFSFTRAIPNKESGSWRSISPLRFPIKRSGSIANRSVSPNPSVNKQRCLLEPRRAVSACRRPESTNRETEMESYTKRSKHLFKALLSVHRSTKEILHNRQ